MVVSKHFLVCLLGLLVVTSRGQNSSFASNKTCSPNHQNLYLCHSRDFPSQEFCPAGLVEENVVFKDVDPYGALFVLLDGLPIALLFALFTLFNANIAATPRHSFVFFYQIIPLVLFEAADRLNVYFRSGGFLWGFVNLNNPAAVSLFSGALPFFALRYCRILLVFLLIPVAVMIANCSGRCTAGEGRFRSVLRKIRRRFAPEGGILRGVCSMLLFTYNVALQVTFALLYSSDCCCGKISRCPRFCQDISLEGDEYIPYWVTATFVLVLCLIPAVAFFVYPAIPAAWEKVSGRKYDRFNHLKPIFDVFQSSFKPRLRFFAGVYLMYRIVLHVAVAFVTDQSFRTLTVTCLLVIILITHLIFRPFAQRLHNYIESLMLVNLIMVSVGTQWLPLLSGRDNLGGVVTFVVVVLTFLTLLPILCALCAGIFRLFVWCRKRRLDMGKSGSPEDDIPSEISSTHTNLLVNEQKYHLYSKNGRNGNSEHNDGTEL